MNGNRNCVSPLPPAGQERPKTVGNNPGREGKNQKEPLLRVAGQVGHRQDPGSGEQPRIRPLHAVEQAQKAQGNQHAAQTCG